MIDKKKDENLVSYNFDTLQEFLEIERTKTDKNQIKLVDKINKNLKAGKFKKLLFQTTEAKQIPYPEDKYKMLPDAVRFLFESNLFFMGDDVDTATITYGADPEFILCDAQDQDKIVLFSSKYRMPGEMSHGKFTMASLQVGGDYGLLELRPNAENTPGGLRTAVKGLVEEFTEQQKKVEEYYKDVKSKDAPPTLRIKEIEAVEFDHKRQRIRERMEDEVDFGGNTRDKVGGVSVQSGGDIGMATTDYYGVSLTAYKRPIFVQGNNKVLTAGGHLHFGGKYIKLLSLKQLKSLIRQMDKKLMPISEKVETKAAKLRRQYYGFPGEFRLKEYGFEYRVLSCAPFWEKNHETLLDILKEAEKLIMNFRG